MWIAVSTRWLCASVLGAAAIAALAQSTVPQSDAQRAVPFGPWPPASTRDAGNRVSGNPAAIELGRELFFESRLSPVGYIGCVTCHQPDRAWSDGKDRAHGLADVDRNTPMLANLRLQRWYGWSGASDSLWLASVRPILDTRELDSNPAHVRRVYERDPNLACWYRRAFGRAADDRRDDDTVVLVNTGKALAAFQETLVTGRTPFDDYRDALLRGDAARAAKYPAAAARGFRFFTGKGNCALCHSGPNFTNGEFHSTGVRHFTAAGRVDGGRFDGIEAMTTNPLNLLSKFNDDASRANATHTRNVVLAPRNWGEFRTPSLRNVAVTGPYMHDGSLATLRDALMHYSELDEDRLHADGEKLLRPLKLSSTETEDLLAFLESLTDADGANRPRPGPPRDCTERQGSAPHGLAKRVK